MGALTFSGVLVMSRKALNSALGTKAPSSLLGVARVVCNGTIAFHQSNGHL